MFLLNHFDQACASTLMCHCDTVAGFSAVLGRPNDNVYHHSKDLMNPSPRMDLIKQAVEQFRNKFRYQPVKVDFCADLFLLMG